jgi:glycosyltransferase involved in cell wall biosynthesis
MTDSPPAEERIAIVLPPREGFGPGRTGAVGMVAHRLAAATRGYRVTVIGGPQTGPLFEDVTFRPAGGALVPAGPNLRYAAAVARYLERDPPALVEVHNRPEIARALGRRFRTVLFLHNDPQRMRGLASPRGRAALLRQQVVTVSEYLRRRTLEGVGSPARPPLVLPNPIDLAALPEPRPPQERAEEVLFAGRVVADKGADAFVLACGAALPRLPGWRAAMVGADRFGPNSPETAFIRDLRPRAARAGVTMRGYRPHDDVMAAMRRAAIVVVPSRWQEPFGLTALEAMASGAALVCSARGGLPEVAGDAALYADPDRPETIVDAIVALAHDPARRAALGRAGRARARRFALPPIAARLDGLLAALIGPRVAGG